MKAEFAEVEIKCGETVIRASSEKREVPAVRNGLLIYMRGDCITRRENVGVELFVTLTEIQWTPGDDYVVLWTETDAEKTNACCPECVVSVLERHGLDVIYVGPELGVGDAAGEQT